MFVKIVHACLAPTKAQGSRGAGVWAAKFQSQATDVTFASVPAESFLCWGLRWCNLLLSVPAESFLCWGLRWCNLLLSVPAESFLCWGLRWRNLLLSVPAESFLCWGLRWCNLLLRVPAESFLCWGLRWCNLLLSVPAESFLCWALRWCNLAGAAEQADLFVQLLDFEKSMFSSLACSAQQSIQPPSIPGVPDRRVSLQCPQVCVAQPQNYSQLLHPRVP